VVQSVEGKECGGHLSVHWVARLALDLTRLSQQQRQADKETRLVLGAAQCGIGILVQLARTVSPSCSLCPLSQHTTLLRDVLADVAAARSARPPRIGVSLGRCLVRVLAVVTPIVSAAAPCTRYSVRLGTVAMPPANLPVVTNREPRVDVAQLVALALSSAADSDTLAHTAMTAALSLSARPLLAASTAAQLVAHLASALPDLDFDEARVSTAGTTCRSFLAGLTEPSLSHALSHLLGDGSCLDLGHHLLSLCNSTRLCVRTLLDKLDGAVQSLPQHHADQHLPLPLWLVLVAFKPVILSLPLVPHGAAALPCRQCRAAPSASQPCTPVCSAVSLSLALHGATPNHPRTLSLQHRLVDLERRRPDEAAASAFDTADTILSVEDVVQILALARRIGHPAAGRDGHTSNESRKRKQQPSKGRS